MKHNTIGTIGPRLTVPIWVAVRRLKSKSHDMSVHCLILYSRNPTHLYFQKRPKFWTFSEILLYQSHSAANLLQIGEKKIAFRNVNKLPMLRERNWQTSGKKTLHLRGKFCFHIVNNMAQNNHWKLRITLNIWQTWHSCFSDSFKSERNSSIFEVRRIAVVSGGRWRRT